MPEDITPKTDATGFPDVAANNAAVAAKIELQGRETLGSTSGELKESSDALDDLAKQVVADREKEKDPKPTAEAKPVIEPTAEEKAKSDAATAEKAAHAKRADEFFKDSPALPPGASPKSSEAFSSIKIKAAQEIATRDTQLEEAKKKIAEYEAKLKDAVPPELVKELEDHRQWRAKLDVDADPKFREFDKQVASSQEFIYSQLLKSPAITPDIIEQIKKHGGPEFVNLEKIFAAVKDPTLQRIVESKVADIEQAKWSKEQAIKSTKANITSYLEERHKAFSENVGAHNTETRREFEALAGRFPWSQEKSVDPKADEPARKAAEEHNAFVKTVKSQLEEAMHDDTPRMRAVMLAATAQLLWMKPEHTRALAELETAKKSLAEANEKLEKLKSTSVGRFRNEGGGASPSGRSEAKPKETDIFNTRAADALDELAKQVVAERARASAA